MNLLEYLQRSGVPAEERVLRGLIMRGDVLVDEKPVTSPQAAVPPGASIRIRGQISRPVSRGYNKLKPVLLRSGMGVSELICADLGASAGGFTQCLLEQGADKVYAVDVGYGLLAPELRNNPRVVVLERTNARLLTTKEFPEAIERVVGDLSFISWRAVLPPLTRLLTRDAELLLLVKPQFELSAVGQLDPSTHGIVKDSEQLESCLHSLYELWTGCDMSPGGVYPAALPGAQGNQEFFIHLRRNGNAVPETVYREQAHSAVAEVAA